MEPTDFLQIRKKLGKTQKEIAELLGVSIKAVHSYEQSWRSIPPHVERQLYFLLSRRQELQKNPPKPCWIIKNCPPSRKKKCPAWEFRVGQICWFINGTICDGRVRKNWQEKIEICKQCEVLSRLLCKPQPP